MEPMKRVSGSFEVRMTPRAADGADAFPARMSLDKHYHGDLEATATGEMLAHTTEVPGSAGYVAIERVSGTLHGRRGTFVLQHGGLMARGAPQLTIEVVPDSGTGELAGLEGSMGIRIEGGAHFYDFEYALPESP